MPFRLRAGPVEGGVSPVTHRALAACCVRLGRAEILTLSALPVRRSCHDRHSPSHSAPHADTPPPSPHPTPPPAFLHPTPPPAPYQPPPLPPPPTRLSPPPPCRCVVFCTRCKTGTTHFETRTLS